MQTSIEGLEEKINQEILIFKKTCYWNYLEGFEKGTQLYDGNNLGFSIFDIPENNQKKSNYQMEILEFNVRRLVNRIFDYLFKIHFYDIRWRNKNVDMANGIYLSNYDSETYFPIEFFIIKNNKIYAYRYSCFRNTLDEMSIDLSRLIEENYKNIGIKHVDRFIQIDWSKKSDNEQEFFRLKTKYSKELVRDIIRVEDFFVEYFSREEYDLFISKIADAVNDVRNNLWYTTIKKLRSNNLEIFKINVKDELVIDEIQYQLMDERGNINKNITNKKMSSEVLKMISIKFVNEERYLSLLGSEKFAKSFITAEYMFKSFEKHLSIDYTAVVCGYMKAVEQLSAFLYDFLIMNHEHKILVLLNAKYENKNIDVELIKKGKYNYVLNAKNNVQYFTPAAKISMHQLFEFFNINKDQIFDLQDNESWGTIYECLKNYSQLNRNIYLHKENIDSYEIASRIRNNSIVVLQWLLGITKISGNKERDLIILGVTDNAFDRLFKKISIRNRNYYYIKFQNEEEKKAVRIWPLSPFDFDENWSKDFVS